MVALHEKDEYGEKHSGEALAGDTDPTDHQNGKQPIIAFYGFALVSAIAVGEIAWLSVLAYALYRVCG